uniref:Uncharacterized protein n=1 Tax=viral metagenome TaxID=1070528 RepID=A0A6C0ADA1_9ZZZZ
MTEFNASVNSLFNSTSNPLDNTFVTHGQRYRECCQNKMTSEKRADKNMLSKFLYESYTHNKSSVFNMMKNLGKDNTPLYQEHNGKAIVLGKTLEQKPSYNTCRFVNDFFSKQLHFEVSAYCDEIKPDGRKIYMHDPTDSTWNKHQSNGGFIQALEE